MPCDIDASPGDLVKKKREEIRAYKMGPYQLVKECKGGGVFLNVFFSFFLSIFLCFFLHRTQ